jgi:hypothetical protein
MTGYGQDYIAAAQPGAGGGAAGGYGASRSRHVGWLWETSLRLLALFALTTAIWHNDTAGSQPRG